MGIDIFGKKLILIGNSGSGKTTIKNILLNRFEEFIGDVSYTTRSKRYGEIDGVDYHFVDQSTFDDTLFLQSVCHNDNYYGTSIDEFEKSNLLIMNPTGINKIPDEYFDEFDIKIVKLMITNELSIKRQLDRFNKGSKEHFWLSILKRNRYEQDEFTTPLKYPYLTIHNDNLDTETTINFIINYINLLK